MARHLRQVKHAALARYLSKRATAFLSYDHIIEEQENDFCEDVIVCEFYYRSIQIPSLKYRGEATYS
jgi:hypothetical protein